MVEIVCVGCVVSVRGWFWCLGVYVVLVVSCLFALGGLVCVWVFCGLFWVVFVAFDGFV